MNFKINSNQKVSSTFLKLGISDFENACQYISELPYKRNRDKSNILCVFEDDGGTCSTKHAVLRKLSLENQHNEIKLMLGIFKMDKEYAPKIARTLSENGLNYIPEAHNYLKIGNTYYDFTKPGANYAEFAHKILIEKEIEFDQIDEEKIKIHKDYLSSWIADKPGFSLEKIWEIREKCIEDLQN